MWKSQLREAIIAGKLDEPSDVDYVPSRFSFKDDKKDSMAKKARQMRAEQRRQVGKSEKGRRASAVEQ